jgi:MEDS: MEthanogen/methylotroph, DcmR Sensory domain
MEPTRTESHPLFFYEDEQFLVDVVVDFLFTGWTSREQIVIVASEQHGALLLAALEQRGLDVPETLARGMLAVLDAHAIIDRATTAGHVHVDQLVATLEAVLLRSLRGERRVRAYGELAGILREQGHLEASGQLEEYWSGVAQERQFAILCGYHGGKNGGPDTSTRGQLCSQHSVTLPSEHASTLGRVESRLSPLFLLERRVQLMEVDLEEARRIEQKLRRDADVLAARHAAAVELLHDFLASSQRELEARGAEVLGSSHAAERLLSRVMQHGDAIASVIRILGGTRGSQGMS